jgi:CDGSH-type Zn-finger protein/uncharacterized Fe-S cluster protein YjdI
MSDPNASPDPPSSKPVPDVEEVVGRDVTVRFEGHRCIHSRYCVLGQPGVFRANVEGAWIHPDAASAEDVALVAQECPSGAITYVRNDGQPGEPLPQVNVLRLRENGPLAFLADLRVIGPDGVVDDQHHRATLCRCGASKNKPWCDNSHHDIAFAATGEPPSKESQRLAERNGPLTVTPQKDGPLQVEGNLEICCGTGRTIDRTTKTWLCRCGHSQNKPFCDGSHRKVGFKAD